MSLISESWDQLGLESKERVLSHGDHTYYDFGCQEWENMADMESQIVDGCFCGVDRHDTQLESAMDALIHTPYNKLTTKIKKVVKSGLQDQGVI